MRFLALALFVVAAATCCLADDVEELVKMAQDAGAPFTQTALKRLQDSGLWGAKRANRTSDAIIMNTSGKSFQLAHDSCALGAYTTGLMPENQIQQRTSTVFGIESSLYLQGVQCTTRYQSEDGSWFLMVIGNPFFGDNAVYASSSWDLKIVPTLGQGTNNQVRFVVSEKFSGGSSMAGGRRPKKTPKGNRNKFLMAPKQGSQLLCDECKKLAGKARSYFENNQTKIARTVGEICEKLRDLFPDLPNNFVPFWCPADAEHAIVEFEYVKDYLMSILEPNNMCVYELEIC